MRFAKTGDVFRGFPSKLQSQDYINILIKGRGNYHFPKKFHSNLNFVCVKKCFGYLLVVPVQIIFLLFDSRHDISVASKSIVF